MIKRIINLNDVASLAEKICHLPPHISIADFIAVYEVAFELITQHSDKLDKLDFPDPEKSDKSEIDSLAALFRNSPYHASRSSTSNHSRKT